jgi:hypothetical protein
MRATQAGFIYFAMVFILGFALGAVRVSLVAPRVGETAGVLIETPLMLAASWLACGWSLRRLGLGRAIGPRVAMGAVAFSLLMAAELGVSVLLFGRSLSAQVANYQTTAGAIGLAAQVAFALIPLVR